MSTIRNELMKKTMRSDDRILMLKPIEGKQPLAVTGLVDKRMFTGENNLHAMRTKDGLHWTLAYDHGNLPEPLRQTFTSFSEVMRKVKGYYLRRNIEIVEVKD